jgi:hypothetical protein
LQQKAQPTRLGFLLRLQRIFPGNKRHLAEGRAIPIPAKSSGRMVPPGVRIFWTQAVGMAAACAVTVFVSKPSASGYEFVD